MFKRTQNAWIAAVFAIAQTCLSYSHVAVAQSANKLEPLPPINSGAAYASTRYNLIKQGWLPIRLQDADTCTSEISDEAIKSNNGNRCFPEILSCSGTGQGFCIFTWWKRHTIIRVLTAGEPPTVAELSYCEKCKGMQVKHH